MLSFSNIRMLSMSNIVIIDFDNYTTILIVIKDMLKNQRTKGRINVGSNCGIVVKIYENDWEQPKQIEKKKKLGRLVLFVFKNYNRSKIIKRAQYWHKNKHIYQWN